MHNIYYLLWFPQNPTLFAEMDRIYYTILYYTMLCYTILYYTILYYTIYIICSMVFILWGFSIHIESWPKWNSNPQPCTYRAHALTTEISERTMRRASDLEFSELFQTNQRVLFLFPTLSKGPTCAVCSKFL